MFAALTFEREPLVLSWGTFFDVLNSWVQAVGGFAAFGLLLWLIAYLVTRRGHQAAAVLGSTGPLTIIYLLLGPLGILLFLLSWARGGGGGASLNAAGEARRSPLTTVLFTFGLTWAFLGYLLLFLLFVPEIYRWVSTEGTQLQPATGWRKVAQQVVWTTAAASAVFAVLVPIVADLARLSLRRVLALARLSFKEAVRRKVLWAFLALLLVVLFGSWFLPHKLEDEVRNYVQVVSVATALMLLLAALLIASFGIPDDIRHQTIHTVLTKPVERFEIFLGRFLGYTALMTLALVSVTLVSLLYVLREVSEEAQRESLKARVPLYAVKLEFEGTRTKDSQTDEETGTNVGRDWDYRRYIFGPVRGQPTQYAIWNFRDLPAALADRDWVRCEFTLDIYRTTKGEVGKGVFCTFSVESWRYDASSEASKVKYEQRRKQLQADPEVALKLRSDPRTIDKMLAEEFGYYEVPSLEVKDYHTQHFDVPAALFKNALGQDEERRKQLAQQRREAPAPVRIRVRCDSRNQFVGMAKHDLFLRLDDPEAGVDRARFCGNFLKGSFGIWLRLCLVIGLAVALSTYLSGVITFLTAGILYLLGFFRDFIQEVAMRMNVGGGPVEAAMRLVRRPGGESMAAPLEETTAVRVSTAFDDIYSWLLRRVLHLIPNVDQFSFTDWVAEGMSIPWGNEMLLKLLFMVGYVLPWAVLAYYLLKWREVASST